MAVTIMQICSNNTWHTICHKLAFKYSHILTLSCHNPYEIKLNWNPSNLDGTPTSHYYTMACILKWKSWVSTFSHLNCLLIPTSILLGLEDVIGAYFENKSISLYIITIVCIGDYYYSMCCHMLMKSKGYNSYII